MGNLVNLQKLRLYGTKLSGESPKKSAEIKLSQFQARDNQVLHFSDTLLSLCAHILVYSYRCSACCSDGAVGETYIVGLVLHRIERYVTFFKSFKRTYYVTFPGMW